MTRLYTARGGKQLSLLPGAKQEGESHANRGREFENALKAMHALYERRGLAVIRKNYVESTVVGDGRWARVDGPAIVDFSGPISTNGRYVAFDAKDAKDKSIPLAALKPHQMAYMGGVHAVGGWAFVLVRFERRRVYRIPIDAWAQAASAHEQGREIVMGDFTATGRASINERQLPPRWRVVGYDWMGAIETSSVSPMG